MKLIFISVFLSVFMHGSSYKYNNILMQGKFNVSYNKNKIKNLNFFYNLGIYQNIKNDFKVPSFCFLVPKEDRKYYVKNKSKFKVCIYANKNIVYILNKTNRYTKNDDFIVKLDNVKISVSGEKHKNKCTSNAKSFLSMTNKINYCLKDINNM
ncbi:hypothetical protein [Arcobacter sp. CECT 8985]|uniref:hypothetical protein n=1 Tax=Arcobacter sp. CECT 8985 TaxID=1935424 RepID=UPI00100B7956|nr:hypothetical protein [Arcobacter sp. CECT 8985]RXJ86682.1 hypothetical protein CRU93_07660 [Arcobacter sp. CECT 8985]